MRRTVKYVFGVSMVRQPNLRQPKISLVYLEALVYFTRRSLVYAKTRKRSRFQLCLVQRLQVCNGIDREATGGAHLGFFPNSRGNKAAANLRPLQVLILSDSDATQADGFWQRRPLRGFSLRFSP